MCIHAYAWSYKLVYIIKENVANLIGLNIYISERKLDGEKSLVPGMHSGQHASHIHRGQ